MSAVANPVGLPTSPRPGALGAVRGWFLAPDLAVNLAVFRICVAFVFLISREVHEAPRFAEQVERARFDLSGAGGALLSLLPSSPSAVSAAQAFLLLAALSGLVGFWSRLSFAVVAVLSLYVLGVPQLTGTVLHDHHLVWFAALLAASPCGDALSLDAWRKGRRGLSSPPASPAYGLPLRLAWLLLACVFFFPGWWKLRESGLDWALSDNLATLMRWKWLQNGIQPPFRVDLHPWLCRAGALATLAFELSAPLLVLSARTRPAFALAAFTFHQLTAVFMGIEFPVLYLCYPVLLDAGDFLDVSATGEPLHRGVTSTAVVGAALLTGAVAFGAQGITAGWPFACFPTFQWKTAERMPALLIEVSGPTGTIAIPHEALHAKADASRYWGTTWALIGFAGRPVDAAALHRYWSSVVARPGVAPFIRGATRVRMFRVEQSVDPDAGWPSGPRTLLTEFEWGR